MTDPIQSFEKHYAYIIEQKKKGQDIIHQEFEEIQRHSRSLESRKNEKKFSSSDGKKPGNEVLNRYRDILPFDATRVKLRHGPYVNASWIGSKHDYIATQGPKQNTIRAFWEIVVQYKIEIIVMLCKLKEVNQKAYYANLPMKEKCADYWPNQVDTQKTIEGTDKLETICVTLKSEDDSHGYVERQLTVKNRHGIQNVTQFQMLQWPDYGVPKNRDEIMKLIDAFRSRKSPKVPILLHCSAGVGRTGTIIALDKVKRMVLNDQIPKTFSVKTLVKDLRQQRMKMVQSEDQYRFLYEMVDFILNGKSRILTGKVSSSDDVRPISAPVRKLSASNVVEKINSSRLGHNRRSLKESRPRSEYTAQSGTKHPRAGIRKSKSVEKLDMQRIDSLGNSSIENSTTDSLVRLPITTRRRPARKNALETKTTRNDGKDRKNSNSSSDIDLFSGPGQIPDRENVPIAAVTPPTKPSKAIVKLKEQPKSKSFFVDLFSRTPKKNAEIKRSATKPAKGKNVSAEFRPLSPGAHFPPELGMTIPDTVPQLHGTQSADSSRSDNSQRNSNPPKPNIIGKMWRTPKKSKTNSANASPTLTSKASIKKKNKKK